VSRWMSVIAGAALVFMMFLTCTDVGLRIFGRPIVGTYEIVGLCGAVTIGFSIPYTSWLRGHIFVDFFIQKFSRSVQNIFNAVTRVIGIIVFIMIGCNLFIFAHNLYKSGEVTLTRQLPFYPIAYGLGICCFIECLVLIGDIIKIAGGKYE
jgi:TRAP-type C4-dicarboxylate transport system permease small subunit